jgi:hypothetical protein
LENKSAVGLGLPDGFFTSTAGFGAVTGGLFGALVRVFTAFGGVFAAIPLFPRPATFFPDGFLGSVVIRSPNRWNVRGVGHQLA